MLKGPYFEYESKSQLEKIKNNFFQAKQIYTIYVDSIIEMDECKTDEDNINQLSNNLISNLIQMEKELKPFLGKKTEREEEIPESQDKNEKKQKQNQKSKQAKNTKKEKKKETKTGKIIEIKNIKTTGEKSNSIINLDEEIEYNIYTEEFKNGIILIKQKNSNGKTLDLGLLTGEKTNKNFIGFQMKFYGEKTKLKNPITKPLIKESLQTILVKCFEKYDIKIKKWDYLMCLYYNKGDEFNYGHYLIENCNKYNIQYFFYNPLDTKFYDRNLKELPFYKLDFKTNIDFIANYNPYDYFVNTGYLEEYVPKILMILI